MFVETDIEDMNGLYAPILHSMDVSGLVDLSQVRSVGRRIMANQVI